MRNQGLQPADPPPPMRADSLSSTALASRSVFSRRLPHSRALPRDHPPHRSPPFFILRVCGMVGGARGRRRFKLDRGPGSPTFHTVIHFWHRNHRGIL
ncbi:hypothetical protein BT67DRAFT_4673 [Trichocladium antarcticum]|uniref:Uncharacterized protein n=1 Tax=Trichocladium antarcticum TaxID=1450529 RepID=A0AAN6US73_9PEZI|nr:hypothetical protein BT67DRAFT_4673 [Trichocladium antarcticum]